MSSVLVVGSIALDTIDTPTGSAPDTLGGSASYASLASSLFERTHVLGVVGEDFPPKYRRLLQHRGILLDNLQVAPGRTFRWSGYYEGTLGVAHTRSTELNVFETFRPEMKADIAQIPYVFLANIDPDLQILVLDQLTNRRFVALDTMNYWIESKKDRLTEAIRRVDCLLMNSDEIRAYTGEPNLFEGAKTMLDLGPEFVVVKKGEHGAMLVWKSGVVFIPAFPLARLEDTTGAGDTFAGSMVGWIARQKRQSNRLMVEACTVGTAMASFACEGMGVSGLLKASPGRLSTRCQQLKRMCDLPAIRMRSS